MSLSAENVRKSKGDAEESPLPLLIARPDRVELLLRWGLDPKNSFELGYDRPKELIFINNGGLESFADQFFINASFWRLVAVCCGGQVFS